MNWYSLRVMSGRENKVKDTIFRELDFEKDLKANVEEILIPTENIVDIKNGKKTVKEKSLLPGYILVKMIMNNETKFFIESVDGVMSFVGPKGSPQPVTEVEMSRYLVSSDGDEFSTYYQPRALLNHRPFLSVPTYCLYPLHKIFLTN